MKNLIIAGIIALLAGAGTLFFINTPLGIEENDMEFNGGLKSFSEGSNEYLDNEKTETVAVKEQVPDTIEQETSPIKTSVKTTGGGSVSLTGYTPGTFFTYKSGIETKQNNKKIVLLYMAQDCADCDALVEDIKANLKDVTPGLAIYEVSHTNEAMKIQYQVTEPNTAVQINSDQEIIASFNAGTTLQELLVKIQ